MTHVSIRTRLVVLIAAVGVAASAAGLLAMVDTRTKYAIAADWAASAGPNLPDTLDELSAYPSTHRRAAFKLVSAETRYRLWQEHLSKVAAGDLTDAQREVVLDLKDALRPEFYVDSAN